MFDRSGSGETFCRSMEGQIVAAVREQAGE